MGAFIGKKLIIILLMLLMLVGMATASDTMLMFVGEDLEVISIASRREEAAWSAPAIADVITREDIDLKGAFTISQALEDTPGFYMNQTEKGSVSYLRGIQNSALFLFDTVPMGSGIRKSDTMIDYETSLAPVKRIEITRGAGSVLWGPDAFAGVVNVVPLSGRDFQGMETGLILSSEDKPGELYMNYGRNEKKWSSFLSVSGRLALENDNPFNVVKFWNDSITPEPVETRYGQDTPEDSQYINFYASATYDDWLTISMKIADSRNAYTVSDWNQQYLWEEQVSDTSYLYKLEASKKINPNSGVRFTGYYSTTSQDHSIVDMELDQEESSLFGEVIYDQSVFHSKGLVTIGASWRQNQFDRVPVWEDFFPDFFVDSNLYFLPRVEQIDFKDNLGSLFGQYRYEVGDIEIWAGARYDDHDEYEDKTSYNTGFAWSWGDFILKSLYGTSYRNPFARQLRETGGSKLEKNSNIDVQLSWKKSDTKAAVTVFRNKIENHVMEDRYAGAGLSTPNSQTIDGIELELAHQLTDNFKLSCNLTLLDNSGPDETYFYNDYTYIDEEGNIVKHYQKLDYAYDTGPDTLVAIEGIWKITDKITLVPKLRYFSQQKIYYPVEDINKTCDSAWIMDANLLVKEIFPFDLTIYLNNLFDNNYSSPGIYSVNQNQSFSAGLMIRMNW